MDLRGANMIESEMRDRLAVKNTEIDKLHAELASRQIDIDTFREGNQKLRAELAAKDRIIANLDERSARYERDSVAKDARIAELESGAAEYAYELARAEIARAEAERDRERLMRKLYEDAAKAWQPRAERAEAELAALRKNAPEWFAALRKVEAERDSLREALSFYADERNWHTPPHCYSAAVSDCGTKARAALAPSPAGPDRYVEDDVERLFEGIDPSPAGREVT